MSAAARKLALTAHVIWSVGWIGALSAFLVLAVVGLGQSPPLARGAYLAMDVVTRCVIVPLALGSVVTGVTLALGTGWGLVRHYWVLFKLLVTVAATLVLLMHIGPIGFLANAATNTVGPGLGQRDTRIFMVAVSGAGLVALVVLTVLSVYKPRGVTPFGTRKSIEVPSPSFGTPNADGR